MSIHRVGILPHVAVPDLAGADRDEIRDDMASLNPGKDPPRHGRQRLAPLPSLHRATGYAALCREFGGGEVEVRPDLFYPFGGWFGFHSFDGVDPASIAS